MVTNLLAWWTYTIAIFYWSGLMQGVGCCIIGEFRCTESGRCIPVIQLCDDKEDCSDGSDEKNCKSGCKPEEFYCPSGECVPWSSTCDNKTDCLDGADEPDVCDILIKEKTRNRTCSLNSSGCFMDCDAPRACPKSIHCYRLASKTPRFFVSAKNLSYMPSTFPDGATIIHFDENSLVILNNQDLRNLTDLQYMSLRKNKITGINEEAFRNLESLKTLLLSANSIQNIPKDLFLDTQLLDVLDLGLNNITKLDVGLFRSQKNLRVLSLRHNPLKTLSDNVFSGLGKLQYLYLDSNRLSQIDPNGFKGLRQLKVLTLNDNKLEILNASWFDGMTQLRILNLRKNGLKKIESGAFKDLKNLVQLYLDSNRLSYINADAFKGLRQLEVLSLRHNPLSYLSSDVFSGLGILPYLYPDSNSLSASWFDGMTQLRTLNLQKNGLKKIESGAFKDLKNLAHLDLALNNITKLDVGLFRSQKNLRVLFLHSNRLSRIDPDAFKGLRQLKVLTLSYNKLETLNASWFDGMTQLWYLSLSSNRLSQIDADAFKGLRQLEMLTLDYNKLETLNASWFDGMTQLWYLNLQKNGLKKIESGAFKDLKNLDRLDLSENRLVDLPDDLFVPLTSLKYLEVDHFTLCCYAKQSRCHYPADDGFSSCDELLKNEALKYSIWVLGVMAVVGNLIVIIWRIVAKDKSAVNSFLLTNLAVADFMMGVYLLIIAYKNTIWEGDYFKHDISWRASNQCFFTGVISTISSEVSVFTLCVITLDRFICCVLSFRFQRISMKKASVIMFFVWVTGTMIALAPLFGKDYFGANFYGRSAVCLPIQLSSDRLAGWEYSVFVFIGLNGFSFLFILVSYCVLYWTVAKAGAAVRSTRTKKNTALARRMLLIILTDFFCWFPVIILSILSLTGNLNDPNKQVYAWIAVFVLPINSSINPILYTFSTSFARDLVNAIRSKIKTDPRRNPRQIDPRGFQAAGVPNTNNRGNRTAIPKPPVKLPESRLEVINQAFMLDERIAGSSSLEPPLDHKHCIRLLEVLEMDGNEEKLKKTLIAHEEVDNNEILCLVHVYNHDHRKLWENTTEILGKLSLDGKHKKIVHCLWSADASKVSVEKQEMIATSDIKLESNDCFICYELPSKSTLQDVIDNSCSQLTSELVHVIAKDLIQAISYLSSKQIVHNAIFPRNIFVIRSPQSPEVSAILGGFHAARSVSSVVGDDENQQEMSELANDIEAYGNILKLLCGACPSSEELSTLQKMTASCLTGDAEKRPSAPELGRQIESMELDLVCSTKL